MPAECEQGRIGRTSVSALRPPCHVSPQCFLKCLTFLGLCVAFRPVGFPATLASWGGLDRLAVSAEQNQQGCVQSCGPLGPRLWLSPAGFAVGPGRGHRGRTAGTSFRQAPPGTCYRRAPSSAVRASSGWNASPVAGASLPLQPRLQDHPDFPKSLPTSPGSSLFAFILLRSKESARVISKASPPRAGFFPTLGSHPETLCHLLILCIPSPVAMPPSRQLNAAKGQTGHAEPAPLHPSALEVPHIPFHPSHGDVNHLAASTCTSLSPPPLPYLPPPRSEISTSCRGKAPLYHILTSLLLEAYEKLQIQAYWLGFQDEKAALIARNPFLMPPNLNFEMIACLGTRENQLQNLFYFFNLN